MPPKAKEVKGKVFFKAGVQIKDVIPSYCKTVARDSRQYKYPEGVQPPQKVCEFEPLPDPEEWPSDDILKNADFGMDINKPFNDEFNQWPQELINSNQYYVFWRKAREFLRQPIDVEQYKFQKSSIIERGDIYFNMEDQYSTVIETQQQIKDSFKLIDQQISVCETFEREETVEENERRRKEQIERITQQQAKDKKKQAKKPEELVEEGFIKVRDVRLTDVEVNPDILGANSIWIGSQLQIIKDRDIRDVYTNRPLWAKIYPQVDGAPVYNPSGKYWVKLYYMGRERKIEIDDRIPCNGYRSFLPQSTIPNQLWAMLVSKAILKLFSYQRTRDSTRQLTGDGFVIYALTGMVSETIEINKMNQSEIGLINEMISEAHLLKKDVFVTFFNKIDSRAATQTNTQKKQSKEYKYEILKYADKLNENFEPEQFGQYSQNIPHQQKLQQFEDDDENNDDEQIHKKSFDIIKSYNSEKKLGDVDLEDTKILGGFAYTVVEQFQNEQFNMVYVQKRSDREMRLRAEYYDICKTNIHKLSKEGKLEHRRRKKEIRERLNEEDKRRIEQITQTVQYRIFRIKSGIRGLQQPSVYCQFSAEEIYIAKKCIINKLTKPPNYDVPEIRGDDKSVVSSQIKINNNNQDDSFQVKPLDDFSALLHALEPVRNDTGGFWLMDKDCLQLYDYIMIYFDPTKLQYNSITQVSANPDNEIATYENMEMMMIEKNQEVDESGSVYLFYGYQAKYPSQENMERTLKPFSMLQRFDLEQFESAHNYKMLDQYVSGQILKLENKNQLFRVNTFSPLNYTIWTSCTNRIKYLSIIDYLIDYEGYQIKKFLIDHPSLSGKKYFMFFKFRIQIHPDNFKPTDSLVFRLKSNIDNYMLKSMRLKLCEVPEQVNSETNAVHMLQTLEGVNKNLYETIYTIQGTQRIPLNRGTIYYLILEGQIPYAIQEGTIEIEFLHNIDVQIAIEQIESVEPLEYVDKYIPTKYGIIFREKLFVNDLTLVSFYVRLAEIAKQEQNQQQPTDKKKAAKAQIQTEVLDLNDTELQEQRLIKLELICNNKTIVYSQGLNQAVLSNVVIQSTKDEKQSYVLQCTFDLREWPQAREISQKTELINWFLSVISSETIAIVRDTTKEDRERAIKKSWEDQEPGRGDRAKKSRFKFQLQIRQQNGEELNEEELSIVNAPRISKKQREEEQKQLQLAQQQKTGKATKKDEKKVNKTGKKDDQIEQTIVQQTVQKIFPKSESHTKQEIISLLTHLEQERLHDEYALHAGLINVRTEQQKKEIREAKDMAKDDLLGILNRNMQMREELKLFQRDQRDTFTIEYQSWRQQVKDNYIDFITNRDLIKQEMATKIKKEKEITDICKQEKPLILADEFEKLLNEAQVNIPNINKQLIKVGFLVLNNIRILTLQDKLSNALNNYDIDTVKTCIDQIEQNQIDGIDQELIGKAEDMIDEANGNPNWLADKQAELKKQGKKGKK